eukprot:TRINITY_DN505_c0_g1_i1.p2 TRINITY_DN505_c0_g1~~TRINITY_DN505_c0_g1_i1.p2  ORF type:complete len:138 (-),score=44.32 TRINITY_DN505_c0_g1_i1:500-913(-)
MLARVALVRTKAPIRSQPTRGYAQDSMGEREKGFEDEAVRRHEREVQERLKEAERKRAEAEKKAANLESQLSQSPPPPPQHKPKPKFSAPPPPPQHSAPSGVSQLEFLEFRKEIVQRVRELEDDIHELRLAALAKKK